MLGRKKWLPIALIFWGIQLALEIYAGYTLIKLDMLPNKYLLAIMAGLLIMIVISTLLFFTGMGKGPSALRCIRRILALILAVVMGVGSVAAATVITRVNSTVSAVTETQTTLQAMVGVYVPSDDTARSIEDAAGYNFGVMTGFDEENTAYAVAHLEDVLGQSLQPAQFASMTELADGLMSGTVDAIVLNEAYTSTLSDFEGYETFEEETRLLMEIPVEKTTTVQAAEAADGDAGEAEAVNAADASSAAVASSITNTPFIMYISGSDTRSAILDTSRSDVNILMVVNPSTRQILLLNTPRDYYVANPAGGGALDKLTHCGIYGISCSMEALEGLYDAEINYYGQINFTGFETLIDAIGGITVESPQAFTAGGYSFTKGANTLNGKQALAFARERYSFSSGDNMRGQNQMRVITAVIEKITTSSTSLLMNYGAILDSLSGMFATNLSSSDIAALVKMQLDEGGSWNVRSYAVTGVGGSERTYSAPGNYAYVMYQDEAMVAKATALIDKVLEGGTLTDSDFE